MRKPKKKPAGAKNGVESTRINLRPEPEVKAAFDQAATAARQSLNQWMITAGLEKVERDKKARR